MKNTANKPLSAWRPITTDTFVYGVPHYPEHVDESYWDRDAARMAECGFNTVRLGEFAWHLFEPIEGRYDFGLFDRAIEGLAAHGIQTILCTPTATPPRWLTAKYPEILRVDGQGRRMHHGSRQHADTAHPLFRAYSCQITEAMATHYRDNPHVIGWQTDNELNTSMSVSYSAASEAEFQIFCEHKYGTIEALNAAWGGNFWATAYRSFDQVVLPRPNAPVHCSPGHVQDYHRFLAFATMRFQRDQVEILRRMNPDWFVFHNMGRLADVDFRGGFADDLDFVGYDVYPLLHEEKWRTGGHAHQQASFLDKCRGFAGNFIVPEQQSGFGSQVVFSTLVPEPGEMRRMAFSSLAHGADGLMFFRWRPAHFGAEIYWMGILDHDDIPRRRFDEAKQIGQEIQALAPALLGTAVRIDVGIAGADFDNEIAHETYPIGFPSPQDDGTLLHRACFMRGIATGFAHPEDTLERLKIFYVPHWLMFDDDWVARLARFAENGGTVIIGARTGSRDRHNHVIRTSAPGPALSALTGVTVEEFGRLAAPDQGEMMDRDRPGAGHYVETARDTESGRRRYHFTFAGRELTAGHGYEILEPAVDAEVIGTWSNRFLAGRAAITRRRVGSGQVIYLGTYLTDDLAEALVDWLAAEADIAPLVEGLPTGIDATLREAEGRRLLFLLNTEHTPTRITNPPTGTDLLTGATVEDTLALNGYGCAVIRLRD
ncbi:beta-galactosidase [Salinisphaera sp. Q1T1-3]|uniref:beta-galactosidase n=1 Tax=Salinisphaera sp. Q1T1-3 TaxID=2321229 RepID=UPI000E7497B9|nr:beta-galactosidase [Salinisphaera sp. Q1T1-3]RJS93485.1 beta-galactosidase [Salinisphaera sp. Q1T1-3]